MHSHGAWQLTVAGAAVVVGSATLGLMVTFGWRPVNAALAGEQNAIRKIAVIQKSALLLR
jgi:hypothetical protein